MNTFDIIVGSIVGVFIVIWIVYDLIRNTKHKNEND